jgi:propionyl-CoA synthetase
LPVADYEELRDVGYGPEILGRLRRYLHWYKKWDRVLDDSRPVLSLVRGWKTNICYNAVDQHALGKKQGIAAIVTDPDDRAIVLLYFSYFER